MIRPQAARRAARRLQATRRPQCAVKWDRNLKPKLAIMRQCTSVTDSVRLSCSVFQKWRILFLRKFFGPGLRAPRNHEPVCTLLSASADACFCGWYRSGGQSQLVSIYSRIVAMWMVDGHFGSTVLASLFAISPRKHLGYQDRKDTT